jgi:excisionase family DNA binding protein
VNDIQSTLANRPFTLKEAAEYLQLPPRTVRELYNRGKLTGSKLHYRAYRFTLADLDAYVAKRKVLAR